MSLLEVKNLSVEFDTNDGVVHAVSDVSFSVDAGETLAIVGESGSGKSQAVYAAMGLLAENGRAKGEILFEGQDLLKMREGQLNRIRANEIAMIFQDSMTSLNPYMRISEQMTETLMLHRGMSKSAAAAESVRMLQAVKIPDARNVYQRFPHECSGGMRQRIMIAMSLLCQPKLLIADEPTTALDVTVQAQIMQLLKDVQKDFGMATILITHDLGVVAGSCENMLVLYGGKVLEYGPTDAIFAAPSQPYALGLLHAQPRLARAGEDLVTIPGNPPNMMLEVSGCPFEPRCVFKVDRCANDMPPLVAFADGKRKRACHRGVEDVI